MKWLQLFRLLLIVGLVILIFVPIIVVIFVLTLLASIPSAIGQRMKVEDWLRKGIDKTLNVERMENTREELYYRYSAYHKLSEDIERWNLIREMESSLVQTRRQLRSGGVILTVLFGSISIIFSIIGQPVMAAVLLFLFSFLFSAIIILRIVIIDILSYDSQMFMEMSTREIAMRMAWNKGPMSGYSGLLIGVLTIFKSFEKEHLIGLDLTEIVFFTLDDDSKWRSETED